MCVFDILKTEKSRVRDRFISYSKYSRRGTLFIQKKVGSALTETENWDLIVDYFITLERSKTRTRQDKFESILEIIESVVSSPFVKVEADSVEYVQRKSHSISVLQKNLVTIIQNISES
jgi:septum formation topological specificity factor MinE